jgi:hypothetical protein
VSEIQNPKPQISIPFTLNPWIAGVTLNPWIAGRCRYVFEDGSGEGRYAGLLCRVLCPQAKDLAPPALHYIRGALVPVQLRTSTSTYRETYPCLPIVISHVTYGEKVPVHWYWGMNAYGT